MKQTELRIQDIVNVDVYPVTDPNDPARQALIERYSSGTAEQPLLHPTGLRDGIRA